MPETKEPVKGEIQLFVDHARTGIVLWGGENNGRAGGKERLHQVPAQIRKVVWVPGVQPERRPPKARPIQFRGTPRETFHG